MKSIKGPLNFKCYSKRYLPTRKGQYEPGCYEPKLIHKRHTFLLLPLSARSVCRLLLRVTVREDRGRPERRAGDSRCVTCPPMGSRCRVQWMKRCKDFLNTRFLMVQTPPLRPFVIYRRCLQRGEADRPETDCGQGSGEVQRKVGPAEMPTRFSVLSNHRYCIDTSCW